MARIEHARTPTRLDGYPVFLYPRNALRRGQTIIKNHITVYFTNLMKLTGYLTEFFFNSRVETTLTSYMTLV